MPYSYQAEKLSSARSSLMLPHTHGEAESIASAFHALSLAFHELDIHGLNETARCWVNKLKEYMDTTGISNPDGEGTWVIKARTFSPDDQHEISFTVDELAHWFDRESGV